MKDTFEILTPQGYEETGKPKKMSMFIRDKCERCGNCCKYGGPVLLKEDITLLSKGILTPLHLFTIRQGELIKSRHDAEHHIASMDLIKVTANALGSCIFYDGLNCTIYQNKPKYCSIYKCWSPEDAFIGLQDSALSREEIFKPLEDAIRLIQRHNELCSYEKLHALKERLDSADDTALSEVTEIIDFDMQCRDLAKKLFDATDDILDLMLGRPLFQTIKEFALEVRQEGDSYVLYLAK